MRSFLWRLQSGMANFMQGRRGFDGLSRALLVVALVLILLDSFIGTGWLYWIGIVFFILAVLRVLSKNNDRRSREDAAYQHVMSKPRKYFARRQKMRQNKDTTLYFKCKQCGKLLSVPRGKGKLRITCPKCHTQRVIDSK
ncbi:MAG: hypothetical protein LBM21_00335 [Coriobacteriales bacterium]|nr:hypothetical protein [Coriobacteriales bacterium]